ncbi:MAG: hypothetical protein FWD52_09735 [Candidatus Bathyarchaeota archaeon]|nr:hypothetical protein [Candidatus Termiticorpusculum sp.]
MTPISRFLALILAFLVLSSLMLLSVVPIAVFGQESVSKPSVPQFSVRVVGDYYYIPPTTTTNVDPYTGKETTTTTKGYYQDEREIEISIKNQPLTPYTDTNGQKYSLYYKVQFKGHFGDKWQNFRPTFQSNSEYTTVYSGQKYVPDAGSQMDFRVEAIVGRWFGDDEPMLGPVSNVYYEYNSIIFYTVLDVVSSGWSGVVTFTVPAPGEAITLPPTNTSPIDPPTLTPEPSTSDNFFSPPPQQTPWATYLLIAIATVCLITIPVAIFAYHYGQRKNKPCPNNSSAQFINGCEVKISD